MSHALSVACPTCRANVEWSNASPWRPFCSARCKRIDLGDWASDRFVITAGESADALSGAASLSGDLKQ